MVKKALLGIIFCSLTSLSLHAAEKTITIYQLTNNQATNGIGEAIGSITFQDSPAGLLIKNQLTQLSAGEHGFHLHENPSCEGDEKDDQWVPGLKAGSHYDPDKTGEHEGPYGEGHKGDLPFILVEEDGTSQQVLLVPRLTVEELTGLSVMIHEGGDNYADAPKPLGGGGARIACGVIN